MQIMWKSVKENFQRGAFTINLNIVQNVKKEK